MTKCVDAGEVEKLIRLLPSEIRAVWPGQTGEVELALPF
jgi:hypothetical protein